jgi:hypothetical protein
LRFQIGNVTLSAIQHFVWTSEDIDHEKRSNHDPN